MVGVLEFFAEARSLLLETCCESMHEHAVSVMPTLGRRELNAWFAASTGERIRQIITSNECPPGRSTKDLLCVTWSGLSLVSSCGPTTGTMFPLLAGSLVRDSPPAMNWLQS